jgi:hypothetical protein
MWKKNSAKAPGRLIKAVPTFDQLLSKYVNKRVGHYDRPAKQPHLPTQTRQAKSIGSSRQTRPNKSARNIVQLAPKTPAWTPPSHYTYIYPPAYPPTYAYTPTIYTKSDVGNATISFWDATTPALGGTLNFCV